MLAVTDQVWLGILNVVQVLALAVLGALVERNRRKGKAERTELDGKLESVLEQLELSVGDLRRNTPKGR